MSYRDRKGTDKDLDKAIKFMRDADKRNVSWAKLELTDTLLARDSGKDKIEAFSLCNELAEAGNAGGYGRLGHMYRDDIGAQKNDEALS
ncbi:MAG: hypothetical protein AB7E75_05030 [Candidatus Methanomethylophilaceae archaeon]